MAVAIGTAVLVASASYARVATTLDQGAGRTLSLNEEVYASASEINFRNQSAARLLQSYGRIYLDPVQATDVYDAEALRASG